MSSPTLRRDVNLPEEMLKGAIAGALGVIAMDLVTNFIWKRQSSQSVAQEMKARPDGLDPAHVIANRAAEKIGRPLSPKQPNPAGQAVHYALGVLPGVAYAAARHAKPGIAAGGGLLFGLGMFLFEDELGNWVMGTSGKPTEYPAVAHARGLIGHAVFGAALHGALRLIDRAR